MAAQVVTRNPRSACAERNGNLVTIPQAPRRDNTRRPCERSSAYQSEGAVQRNHESATPKTRRPATGQGYGREAVRRRTLSNPIANTPPNESSDCGSHLPSVETHANCDQQTTSEAHGNSIPLRVSVVLLVSPRHRLGSGAYEFEFVGALLS